jgi:hypothetical protein
MPTFLVLASLYNTVLFRITFNEKIGFIHGVGMLIMVAGIVFLGVETSMKSAIATP